MINQTHNPDVLSCLANLSNDEVFTPPGIANAMLDMLPQELFSSPDTTFLDPCCKSGVFLREIAKRLNTGLKSQMPDQEKRLEHIFKKQLFGIAITELTSLLSRRAAYCSKYPNSPYSVVRFDNAEGHIRFKNISHSWHKGKCRFCGASEASYGEQTRGTSAESHAYEFIHTDHPEALFHMKFDVIIGNPPYQLSDGGNGVSATPIFQHFVDQAKKLSPRYLSMIIPARWYAGGKGLDDFRAAMLNDQRISKLIDYESGRDCFDGVNIAGGICYFLWDTNHKGKCEIANVTGRDVRKSERDLNEFPILIRSNTAISIVHKVLSKTSSVWSDYAYPRNPFGFSTNYRGRKSKKAGDIEILTSEGFSYVTRNEVVKNTDIIDHYKILIGRLVPSNGELNVDPKHGYRVITDTKIIGPQQINTETYLDIGVFPTEVEAKNFEQFLKTKFVRYLLRQAISSLNVTRECFRFVPKEDFTQEWTDEELYARYGLTDEEQAVIEKTSGRWINMNNLFEQKTAARPMIYAYTDDQYPGCLKVGYTAVDVEKRVAQQYPTKRPDGGKPYHIVFSEPALYEDGSSFTDHAVHRMLEKKGIECVGGEWFRCAEADVRAAWLAVRTRSDNLENRTRDFAMRSEQQEAVERTWSYFQSEREEGRTPRFLWNAKMRFGKTFAAYQLAKRLKARRVLILTFKPAVQTAWQEDLETHMDFEGWQFICKESGPNAAAIDAQYQNADHSRPIVCFGSFQDFLGGNKETGGIKPQHEWVRAINWDLVIFDEYHFGAWKENARSLFLIEDEDTEYSHDATESNSGDTCNEDDLPITSDAYLYLSGTPFRALNSGEFIEEQIYSWTYSDEQRAKENWQGEDNPYASLPRMVMLTYRMPEDIQNIALGGEFNEFDLNVFFAAEGRGDDARFTHENEVQKWLDLIRGSHRATALNDLKLGAGKPPMPYSDVRLMGLLNHTLWFLPNVAACHAMANLLKQRQNTFYHAYKVIVCAGTKAGTGAEALPPVLNAMGTNPLESKSITLSCGKLTTGVTVKPWAGVFMLRNLSSPETYFQTAFRVQSPWEVDGECGKKEIVKKNCYVFDFALNRALRQISDYSCRLNTDQGNPEVKVKEFISFLPVLAYDGSAMKQVDAAEILDMAMSGTSATMLARRWESALLVNVDNVTLQRLLNNPQAMDALMKMEGFRNLNSDIETIINRSEALKSTRKKKENLSRQEKAQLSDDEKKIRSLRKQVQEKLIRFAARIPIFMYLSDLREYCLKDVITQLEPGLFRKVTGLTEKDFELLVSLNVFNESVMNDAVYKFKRYEDASLNYTGIDRHEEEEKVGLFSTSLSKEEYDQMAEAQQLSMTGNQKFS